MEETYNENVNPDQNASSEQPQTDCHATANGMNPIPQPQSMQQNPSYASKPVPTTNAFAVTSFILGITTWVMGWIFAGLPAIVGIVFGVLGMKLCKEEKRPGYNMALAGFLLSMLMLITYVFVYIAILVSGTSMISVSLYN